VSHTAHTAIRYKLPGRSALLVQAGTATSTRERGEPNSFSMLRIERQKISVERYVWQPVERHFAPADLETFQRTDEGWERPSPKDLGVKTEV
jgi:hypothetical protein